MRSIATLVATLAVLALLLSSCAHVARAQTADADAETADPTGKPSFNSILLNNGTKNCVIYSYLGFIFREGLPNYYSEWVLSFEFTLLANYGPDRLRFDRGANVVIHQLEKKDQSPTSKESAQDYQKWFIDADGAIKTAYNNYTLNVEGGNTNPGTRLVMWAGTPGTNEKFYMDANHRICSMMPNSNVCLEIIADRRSETDLYVRMGTPIDPPAAHQQWWIRCEK